MDTFIQLPNGQLINKEFASDAILKGLSSGLYKEVQSPSSSPKQTPPAQVPAAPALSGISSPAQTPMSITAPTLPTPQAPAIQESFFTSLTSKLETAKSAVEGSYQKNIDKLNKKIEESKQKIADWTEKQEAILEDDVKPLTSPFREDLENAERERLYITENFEKNQALTRELESLLTEGNEIIKQGKAQPLAMSVINKKVNKTINDVTARTGVIEAVMSARSGQISEAYRMIDRSVEAITADRKDQLEFYSSVFDFYENQKDEEGNNLVTLEKDQKDFVKAQIGILEDELASAQKNSDYIKKLMTDSDSALFMADAGITLNDSPEVVSQKMAAQAKKEEIKELKNKLIKEGYTFVPFPQKGQDVQTFTVGGQTLSFKKPAESKSEKPLETVDIQRIQELYGVTVPFGSTQAQAEALVNQSNAPEAKLKSLIEGAQTNGNTYETVIKEIENDATITDKETAKQIAADVYGITEEVSEPVYGKGGFASMDINDRVAQLQQILGTGVAGANNEYLKKQLLKDGYPSEAIKKITSGFLEKIGDSIFSFLFN